VWLCANNRVAEAEEIIRNAAKLNNISMPEKILARPETSVNTDSNNDFRKSDKSSKRKTEKLVNKFKRSHNSENRSTRYTIVDIFRNRRLTINIICMSILWSVPGVS